MTLKTSIIIGGDASGAKREVADLGAAVTKVGADARGAAAPIQQLDQAQRGVASSAKTAAAAVNENDKAQAGVAASAHTAAAAAAQLSQANVASATGAKAAAQAAQANEVAQTQAGAATRAATAPVQQLDVAQRAAAASARTTAQAVGAGSAAMTGAAAASRAATASAQTQKQAQAALAQQLQAAQAQVAALTTANQEAAQTMADMAGRVTDLEAKLKGSKDAHASAASGAGAHKAAMQNLSFQIQDVGASLSTVSGPQGLLRIFAQQGGQIFSALGQLSAAGAGASKGIKEVGESSEEAGGDAAGMGEKIVDVADKVENTGSKLGKVAGFLAGPWGAALLVATTVLGPFIGKLFESEDAGEKAAKGGLALVDALGKQKFATDAAREAIKAYTEQQEKGRKETELGTRTSLAEAEVAIRVALATREKTQAKLAEAEAQAKIELGAEPGGEGGIAVGLTAASIRTAAIQKQLVEGAKAINVLLQSRRDLLIQVGTADGEAAADPIKAIDLKYNLQRQQAEAAAASNTKLARSIDDTVKAIERRRDAEKKEEQERQRKLNAKPEKVSLGDQVERLSAANILATAERYKGLSENKAGDRAKLADLFSQAKVGNIDPTITAWCAAFVNSVLAANGVKGTGSLAARSFLGFGQSTDAPNKGDIVVSKRGNNAAQGHVGFYQGTDAKGNILVLGGNTGDKVGTQTIARSNVLGFRKAPSAADAYKETQQAAETASKEQQRALDQVVAKYLPATAAAKEYADELARIDALAKSYDGKDATSGLTAEQATAARVALKAANDKKLAEINLTPEAKAAADAKKSIDGVVQSLGFELAARKSLDPVQKAMAQHQDELAKLSDTERKAYEDKLKSLYAQDDAYKAVEDATRAAAEAQRQFRDMALDAFDAIVLGGESAGKVIDRLAQTIASAAIEAAVLGTGPLAALLKGAGTAAPVANSAAAGASAQVTADLTGKAVSKGLGDRLDSVFGKGNSGKLLQGAGFGYTAASVTGGSGIGGALGGAVGGKIAEKAFAASLGKLGSFAGPLGSIAGGILGGVVGKLFSGKPKEYGSSAISFDGGTASAGAAIGKGTSEREKASALGGSVADGLNKIAQQLGGALGSANVSIGYRPGHKAGAYRVDTSGGGKVTGVEAFETEAEAIAFAIRDAITDGAVTGLSAAVQKAIQSSTDVDKALAEALKVQDLEVTMGGITAQIDKSFREFEATAKERVRIATQYGFDLVAIEKKNGEDRAKLAAQLASEQVGSLQKLIDEMTQGSLFEGTAMDKITALNKAIDKAKVDLTNGVEGAGDTLANLYQQKLATSKEAYATTSGYAADRTATIDDARTAVAAANARIAAAQAKTATSDPALKTTNATLDEIVEQNAKQLAAQSTTNALLAGMGSANGYSPTFDLKKLASY